MGAAVLNNYFPVINNITKKNLILLKEDFEDIQQKLIYFHGYEKIKT